MSKTQQSRGSGTERVSHWRTVARRDQLVACVIGAALLGVSAWLRHSMDVRRTAKDENGIQLVREDPESEKKLGSLAVTLPRLTLGGLRGIASTYLWMQAEDDKNNRKWEGLETDYDMIGALQPYFASVYWYHAWNEAYNISAQWQQDDIKYKWVLDGLAYLYKGEDFNPGHPDLLYEEAQMYAMKLGGAAERLFYRRHFREDLWRLWQLDAYGDKLNVNESSALQHVRDIVNRRDPRDGYAYFLTEERRPKDSSQKGHGITIKPYTDKVTGFNLFKDKPKDQGNPDGSLDFPYGVSPFYFAFIEYERCMQLPVGPTYTNRRVVATWPAMSLRLWCRDDLQYLGETMRNFFQQGGEDAWTLDNTKAGKTTNEYIDEMGYCFRNIQMIAPRAVELFDLAADQAIKEGGNRDEYWSVHRKHQLEALAYKEISKAEYGLFKALVSWRVNNRNLTDDKGIEIQKQLREAMGLYTAAIPSTQAWVDAVYPPPKPGEAYNRDRDDFLRFVQALKVHADGINKMLATPDNKNPDLSFLQKEATVVEQ